MAILTTDYPNLATIGKTMDASGNMLPIVNMLVDINPIIHEFPIYEANQGSTNLTAVRTDYPTAEFRGLYEPAYSARSNFSQVVDTCGMIERWSEADAALVDMSNNPQQVRHNEAMGILTGMSRRMAEELFYGNTDTNKKGFMGLSPRFSDLGAANGSQIIDGGGTGTDNTSIWQVAWGPMTVYGIHPRGTPAGLVREDLGKETKEVTRFVGSSFATANHTEGLYQVYREKFCWSLGLVVADWTYVTRIANVDVNALADGNVDMYSLMSKAEWKLKGREVPNGRRAIYCNTSVLEALDNQAVNRGNGSDNYVRLTPKEIEGKEVMMYRGTPIRQTDAIINTEERVQ